MTKSKRDLQKDGRYDDTLLKQGKYREWFYESLSPEAKSYLTAPPTMVYGWTCQTCKTLKPRHEFSKVEDPRHRQCNACMLASNRGRNEQDSLRWENKYDTRRWTAKAACLGADPEIFHPKSVDEYLKPDAEWRKYCPGCPIKDLCIEQIRASTQIPQGVFGGVFFSLKKPREAA